MSNKKVKVTNPNVFVIGLKLMDGIREVPVHPKSFINLEEDEIYFLNNMCTLFKRKMLLIHDNEVNEFLGFATKSVIDLSDDEIQSLLKGNIQKMKKEFESIKEKHIIDRIVSIAKDLEDLNVTKVKFIQEWSGYDFEQLVNQEE